MNKENLKILYHKIFRMNNYTIIIVILYNNILLYNITIIIV